MKKAELDIRLAQLTQELSEGFTRAYNAAPLMKATGDAEHTRTSLHSVVFDDSVAITTEMRGNRADLFARTFTNALTESGIDTRKKKDPTQKQFSRTPIFSPDTNEFTDRQISYKVSLPDAEDFLGRLANISKFVKATTDELADLYNLGIAAQNDINIGRRPDGPVIGTKFHVDLRRSPDEKSYQYLLRLHTNNIDILKNLNEVATFTPDLGNHLRVKPIGQFDKDFKKYESGVEIAALTQKGNEFIREAINKIRKDRNMTSGTSLYPPG